ncbi:hypothetical protein BEP19_03470 [Ammoniphilus oxalaticus]|uniref:PBP domain-containing protein n=1 Tax=Ammoniphilus oxalaticus TaxID=66863 RepID=A0A419SNY8_9BACL|nr:substrate-binding domain-containing protein [Ammoniphilus oxalaticus]RKD25998.1 hypothetical protein BEP19_03470 [Ammoniphilus oxalaticus]
MKVFSSILITGGIAFAGFIAMFFAAFSQDAPFFMPFVVTVSVIIAIFSNLVIWGQANKKWFKWGLVSFISLSVISVGGYKINQKRIEDLQIMSRQDVDLSQYTPNHPNSRAVRLQEEPTFKIKDNPPRLDGSTALYPVFAGFAQAVYPEKEYNPYDSAVVSTQTSHAYERLLRDEVDLIFVPEPSKKYIELAKERGKELKMVPFGKEAFVFFTHVNNNVDTLTVEQIRGIYSGNIRNWKEVGGGNGAIEAFQRPEESGSQQALIRFMGDEPIMKPSTERVAAGMGGIIDQVAEYQNKENAIGYSFRYFSEQMVQNGAIRNIAVNGVPPTKETIRDGTYPITSDFYIVTAGSDNPHLESFIEWILSEQGQTVVEETGYVSASGK